VSARVAAALRSTRARADSRCQEVRADGEWPIFRSSASSTDVRRFSRFRAVRGSDVLRSRGNSDRSRGTPCSFPSSLSPCFLHPTQRLPPLRPPSLRPPHPHACAGTTALGPPAAAR
jgi:hypothetical protein